MAVPTLRSILDRGGKAILMSHLGRPKGEVNPKLSLAPVAKRLGELLEKPVALATDTGGQDSTEKAHALSVGDVLVLENVRFNPGEKKGDDVIKNVLNARVLIKDQVRHCMLLCS